MNRKSSARQLSQSCKWSLFFRQQRETKIESIAGLVYLFAISKLLAIVSCHVENSRVSKSEIKIYAKVLQCPINNASPSVCPAVSFTYEIFDQNKAVFLFNENSTKIFFHKYSIINIQLSYKWISLGILRNERSHHFGIALLRIIRIIRRTA